MSLLKKILEADILYTYLLKAVRDYLGPYWALFAVDQWLKGPVSSYLFSPYVVESVIMKKPTNKSTKLHKY